MKTLIIYHDYIYNTTLREFKRHYILMISTIIVSLKTSIYYIIHDCTKF